MAKELVAGFPKLLDYSHPYTQIYCPGCHYPTFIRALCETVEELEAADDAILVTGAGCCFVSFNCFDFDGLGGAHGRSPDIATGIKRALHGKPLVFTLQGDGDTIAIGAGSLIAAATRAERITVFMINNGVYGTTGGQLAPTTLMDQTTTTSPKGRTPEYGFPTHTAELVAHLKGTAYSARCSLTSAANYKRTKKCVKTALQKQIDDVGFSFVEILSTCPTNWHLSPVDCVKRVDEVVTKEYPLGEFKNVDTLE